MLRVENQCVDCGLPCIHNACPYYRVPVYYCDICGNEDAGYTIEGQDYCEDCAKEYLKDAFNNLTVSEKAKALDIDLGTKD